MKKKVLILVGIFVLACVGKYVYDVNIDHNFEPITEGKVYKSGVIPPDELPDYISEYNIKTVIDLRNPGTNDLVNNPEVTNELSAEKEAIAKIEGTNYFNVPSHQIPDKETLKAYFKIMDNPDNYPVLVHCHHGEGRAPLFGAIYRIEYEGMNNDEARKKTRWFADLCVFNGDKSKGKYLLDYKPEHHSVVAKK
ncbi:MAG: protein phosphatase [Flavobacterium sp. MedPE-SWcel]|uniref:dual specificity protein phosphatase family protein n=1 Tax=uncultured Flavobacterium sp. TaxID=165435 RepID=UPI00091B1AB3|nr:dual specificity protein phosphatase family protein [uncultured Flavobacterium sp.]OIQ22072.1 MAG: protein phosphatase [Flavobacterium sp. MedPE-SWcel]